MMARSHTSIPIAALFVALVFAALSILPLAVSAQESGSDLRATIRAELMSDPRTNGLSESELSAMVDLLAQEASKQGITVRDIQWRPTVQQSAESAPVEADYCGATPAFLCTFNIALGFAGTDPTIPFILGAASMGLIWILAEMIHRRRHPAQVVAQAPLSSM